MPAADLRQRIEAVYRSELSAVLATLIRLLGDLARAEEALHEAFRAVLERRGFRPGAPPPAASGARPCACRCFAPT